MGKIVLEVGHSQQNILKESNTFINVLRMYFYIHSCKYFPDIYSFFRLSDFEKGIKTPTKTFKKKEKPPFGLQIFKVQMFVCFEVHRKENT